MSPDEIVAMSIVFGSIVSIFFIVAVGSVIKAWIRKGSKSDLSENKEFLNALREFKENMERRMSNLEAIVLEDENRSASLELDKNSKSSQNVIELEMEEESGKDKQSRKSGKLENMLNK